MAVTIQSVPAKLRHMQTFTSSGTFYPPAGTTVVYVAVLGATGGIAVAGTRYAQGNAGAGASAGGYVQVNPSAPHTVTIGAGGTIGIQGIGQNGKGNTGGTTIFDGAITQTGSEGGNIGSNQAGTTGAAANAGTAVTTLPSLNPSNSASPRVSSFAAGSATSGNGTSGVVHIYGY